MLFLNSLRQTPAHGHLLRGLFVALLILAALGFPAVARSADAPNVLIIYADDQRWDSLSIAGHPFLTTPHIDRIGEEGVEFAQSFVTTPVCSPSRASFLTGQYKHTHGVVGNGDYSELSQQMQTFPRILQRSGYRTGYIGKWHMGNSPDPRPGFDRWVSFAGQGLYSNPPLNIDGQSVRSKGYLADVLTEHALKFIAEPSDKPFCLIVAHKGPHSPFTPAERHRALFDDQVVSRRANATDDLAGKPMLTRRLPGLPKTGPGTGPGDGQVRDQLRTITAIDEGVGRLLAALEARGELENTVVIYTSDHGYYWGEHGLSDKRAPYDEALRVPLLIRYPRLIGAGTVSQAIATNMDVGPTVLNLAGVTVPGAMQGQSLVPVIGTDRAKDADFRNGFFAEYSQDLRQERIATWRAFRTADWKYIQYPTLVGSDELYDLAADPYELNNLALHPESIDDVRLLEAEMLQVMQSTNHPGRSSRAQGVVIDRWQVQNVRGYEEARRRERATLLSDGSFNSGFVLMQPDGSTLELPPEDKIKVLTFLEADGRDDDIRVVAHLYDEGQGLRLVDLTPDLTRSTNLFTERNGMITIEAEQANRAVGFSAIDSPSASGEFAMQADEQVEEDDTALEFRLHVKTPGRWYVWIRTQALHHRQNGLRLRLDGNALAAPADHDLAGTSNIYLRKLKSQDDWSWAPEWQPTPPQEKTGLRHQGPVAVELSAGEQSLTVLKRRRERPLIDKIVLTRSPNAPSGFGPPQ